MPRIRQRATLESGPKVDLAELIPRGSRKSAGHVRLMLAQGADEIISASLQLWDGGGLLELFHKEQQAISLVPSRRRFGGLQWYAICPVSGQRARVLYRPLGAKHFASRHAWGNRVAYASQFLDPIQRAWRTKEMVKAQLIGDEDPDEWDVPPKPKGMRWVTYERWVARYDAADKAIDARLSKAVDQLI